ncbi:MAG TPA: Eco57I restriction-modification methylase domain-containing protein, partial [Thermoanaerobaculia bacterium]|nr:Eco57I restriction-modification methylase domain-containing protein [Thermoanaerobaculia bacterium]
MQDHESDMPISLRNDEIGKQTAVRHGWRLNTHMSRKAVEIGNRNRNDATVAKVADGVGMRINALADNGQSLDSAFEVSKHLYQYGQRATGETHGVVLTKSHIVRLILDLANYSSDRNLTKLRLLEHSCGEGAFLVEAVRRLLASAKRHRAHPTELRDAIRAYDIDSVSVTNTRDSIRQTLIESGVDHDTAETLVGTWIRHGDFLLASIDELFDVIVGNPPYVRIEQLDQELQTLYRSRFETLFDRADLYVAFIERSLELLSLTGVLSFICADRWTLNRYGAPLRGLISREYGVKVYVDLHHASPFESDVIAYPSILALERRKAEHVVFATLSEGSARECRALTTLLEEGSQTSTTRGLHVSRYERWFESDEPWVLGTPKHLVALRDLE